MIKIIVDTKESNVRIKYNLDKQFFAFVKDELGKSSRNSWLHDKEKIIPLGEVVDVKKFGNLSHRLFDVDSYHLMDLGDKGYLVYRDLLPPLDKRTTESLQALSFDPTNGTYSEGYHAILISRKE